MSDNFGSFKWLGGDVNYVDHGGTWYRKVGDRNYHVIELQQWNDLDNTREKTRYNVTLCEVDVGALAETKQNGSVPLKDALRSCGWKINTRRGIVQEHDDELVCANGIVFDLVCLEALHGHGNKARLADLCGNNWRKLIREASQTSRELDPKKNPEAHEEAMEAPGNGFMSSKRNMMLGIIFTKDR